MKFSKMYVFINEANFSCRALKKSNGVDVESKTHDDRSCAWPFYSLVQGFPKALHSDQQGGGDYMTGLVQTF